MVSFSIEANLKFQLRCSYGEMCTGKPLVPMCVNKGKYFNASWILFTYTWRHTLRGGSQWSPPKLILHTWSHATIDISPRLRPFISIQMELYFTIEIHNFLPVLVAIVEQQYCRDHILSDEMNRFSIKKINDIAQIPLATLWSWHPSSCTQNQFICNIPKWNSSHFPFNAPGRSISNFWLKWRYHSFLTKALQCKSLRISDFEW